MEEAKIHSLEKIVNEGVSGIEKLQILMAFKTHVKKELVDENAIEDYFDVLVKFLSGGEEDYKLRQLGHSSLCYLIKRVAMQQPGKFQAKRINELVRAVLLQGLSQERKVWMSAMKSLEAIYLCKPLVFETELCQICLEMRCNERTKCLLFMDELIQQQQANNRDPMELVNRFLDLWIQIMNEEEEDEGAEAGGAGNTRDVELIHELLKKYHDEVSLEQIATRVTNPRSLGLFQPAGHARPSSAQTVSSLVSVPFEADEELTRLMEELPPNIVNLSMADSKDYLSFEHVSRDLEQITVCFQALKETEFNWKQRQEGIITIRRIVNGNVPRQFPDEFIQTCKDLNITDCISKAALSLRTTLSSHSCHLMKELALKLGARLDPLVDSLFIPLRSLLSATKKIASQTAFATAVIILSNAPYHNRLFQQCLSLSRDKNVSPRNFAAVFLRVYIIRFHKRLEHSVLIIEEWLHKGLSDPQTQVRETMRVTFWYWYSANPLSAKKVLDSLPHQMKRAIELAIPAHLNIDYQMAPAESSNESSRRSSLGARRFPSYAAPTQSSNLQKLAANALAGINARSICDSSKHLTSYSSLSLAKKSFSTTRHDSVSPRIVSNSSNNNKMMMADEHIDLTDELTTNHSNTLVKKYLNDDPVALKKNEQESIGELESMYSHISSDLLQERQQGLQFLQNLLLMKTPLDSNRLQPFLIQLSIQSPKSFKELTIIPSFHSLIPLINLVELCAINEVATSTILDEFPAAELIRTVITSFQTFFPDNNDQLFLFYVKYRSVIFNYCFEILIDIIDNGFRFSDDDSLFHDTCVHVFQACGNDFNMDKYYSLISILYNFSKSQFIELLREAPVSSKFKIANELQRRDPTFNLHAIISRESTAEASNGGINTDNEGSMDSEHGIQNTQNLLEMTMVNHIAQDSGENVIEAGKASVVQNGHRNHLASHPLPPPAILEENNRYDDETGRLIGDTNIALAKNGGGHKLQSTLGAGEKLFEDLEDEHGFTSVGGLKGLTEMTKVVSVYQTFDKEGDLEMAEEEKFKDPVDQENHVTGLDDIFKDDKHEPTVKFNDIPRIIDINRNWDRQDVDSLVDTSGNITNNGVDENHTNGSHGGVAEMVEKEMDKSPKLPLNEEDSKLLSDGITEMEIRKQNDDPFVKLPKTNEDLTVKGDHSFISSKAYIDILSIFPPGSLSAFELELLNGMDFSDMDVEHIEEAINTIQNSKPKIADISCLVGALFHYNSSAFITWLTKYQGVRRIWEMITAFMNTGESTSQLYKCIILCAALIVADTQLHADVLSNLDIDNVWSILTLEMSKLSSYDNTFYVSCCEFRDLIIEHYSKGYLQNLLENCIKDLSSCNERIKTTFILQSIDNAISHMDTILSLDVLRSLSGFLQKFVSSSFTEWRYHSVKLLSQIYLILLSRHTPRGFIKSMLNILQPHEYELVKSFHTIDHD